MKLVDASLLLYAVNEDAPNHSKARSWLEDALSGTEPIAFAWVVLLAFLRLSTKSIVVPKPMKIGEALTTMEFWLSQPSAEVVLFQRFPGLRWLNPLA